MLIELAKAKGVEKVEVPDKNIIEILKPNEVEVELTGMAEVERAINNPIGSARLSEIVKPGESIAIITSDITRPIPSYKVLPPLLKELKSASDFSLIETFSFAASKFAIEVSYFFIFH